MCFFRRKNETEKIIQNKNYAQDMANSIDVLLALAKDNNDLCTVLTNMQDRIKYFNPSIKSEVLDLDKKINKKLSELKTEISQARNNGEYATALSLANDLNDELLTERESKSKRR